MTAKVQHTFYIGIDPGVNTGVAVWNKAEKKLDAVHTMSITKALEYVKVLASGESVFIRVEDARQRKWFGKSGREQLQGAGSIKRDCSIWEEHLKEIGAQYQMVAPKNNKTKMNAQAFKQLTGWDKQTNEHGRDSAMLVFGM